MPTKKPFLSIEMLPAYHGDCLWIEYGRGDEVSRILIDGGPVTTWDALSCRIAKMPPGDHAFELIVLSHVDADHIEGIVRLFAEKPPPIAVDNVWFNGWRQLKRNHGLLGPLQGEFLTALLARRAKKAWNPDGPPVCVPEKGRLPAISLDGGMLLTLLSPSQMKLDAMARTWKKTIEPAGISPGDLDTAWEVLFRRKKLLPKQGLLGASDKLDKLLKKKQLTPDRAKANGSSIAFLAEFEGKRALFLADAHIGLIVESLTRLCQERGIDHLDVDAVKVSHHGSKGNISKKLLKLISSRHFLFSTNGDIFKHPDTECIEIILENSQNPVLCFNYESFFTMPWLKKENKSFSSYSVMGPKTIAGGIKVVL